MRWIFRVLLVATAAMTLALGGSKPEPAAQHQNIVVVMTDDLDFNLAKRLYTAGRLPQIEAALGAGTVFTNSFVTTAVCCPSRSTFLTGQYTHNHGVLGNILPDGGVTRLDDTSTVATWLHDAGYYVGFVGKYLNGYGTGGSGPLDPAYIPPGYDWWGGVIDPSTRMYDYQINLNGTIVQYGSAPADYQTDVIAGLAADFIATAPEPFFLIVMPTAPHVEVSYGLSGCRDPWRASIRPSPRHIGALAGWSAQRAASFNEGNMTDKPAALRTLAAMTGADMACNDQIYRDRAESMLAVDDLIGTVAGALGGGGYTDRTTLIFTSDNGYYHGEHRLTQKLFGFEEGIRVPLMIKQPASTSRQIVRAVVLNNDLAPTIADLADATPARVVDGRSLLPLIANPSIPWRDTFLVEYLGRVASWPGLPNFQSVRTPNHYYSE